MPKTLSLWFEVSVASGSDQCRDLYLNNFAKNKVQITKYQLLKAKQLVLTDSS